MKRWKYGLVMGFLLVGCESPSDLVMSAGHFLVTGGEEYTAVVTEAEFRTVQFTVDLTYTNHGEETLYVSDCGGLNPPQLERFGNGGWEVVYQPDHLLCGGAFAILPEEEMPYEFHIHGLDPRGKSYPKWQADEVEGYYRVVWRSIWSDAERSGTIPLEQRVSNTFRVTQAGS